MWYSVSLAEGVCGFEFDGVCAGGRGAVRGEENVRVDKEEAKIVHKAHAKDDDLEPRPRQRLERSTHVHSIHNAGEHCRAKDPQAAREEKKKKAPKKRETKREIVSAYIRVLIVLE